eukprot:gene19677-21623_t
MLSCLLCKSENIIPTHLYKVDGKGKFNVRACLKVIEFRSNSTSPYICRSCLEKLKKLDGLRKKLNEIVSEIHRFGECDEEDTTGAGRSFHPGPLTSTSTPNKPKQAKRQLLLQMDGAAFVSPAFDLNKESDADKEDLAPSVVRIKVVWPAKTYERDLPAALHSLGKMLIRGTYKQIARAAWRNENVRKELKPTMARFRKLRLVVSPTQLCRKLDEFGEGYDGCVRKMVDDESRWLEVNVQGKQSSCTVSGQKITIDNVDYRQEVHHMTQDHQTVDNHYLSVCATKNWISGNHLSPVAKEDALKNPEFGKCIPNSMDQAIQRLNYIVLVEKMLAKHVPCLKQFQDVITKHIPHLYSDVASSETETTFLGLLYHNENDADGIVNIPKDLHQYVPTARLEDEQIFGDLAIVGDQLTVERGVNAHNTLVNGFERKERLEGLHFEFADWHGINKGLEVAFSRLYSGVSVADKCTLYSDRNLINKTNVKADVIGNVNACRRFFTLEVEAHIVAAAMEELELNEIDETPSAIANIENWSKQRKKEWIHQLATEIFDKYVLDKQKHDLFIKACLEMQEVARVNGQQLTRDGKYPCCSVGCNKALIEYGMLIENIRDAVSAGDGLRIIRCWKFFLVYFKNDAGSQKYSLEILFLMFQIHALLSPRSAHQLIWNRFHKSKNSADGNISLDLNLEFHNRVVKEIMKKLGPNCSRKSMNRICHAMHVSKALMEKFDHNTDVFKRSGVHKISSQEKDLRAIVKELNNQKAMSVFPGRSYTFFKDMKSSLLSGFDLEKLYK